MSGENREEMAGGRGIMDGPGGCKDLTFYSD